MSVIIRLQNLPWSANAMDIRQFFKGLSIPEGGVHIVGGEMGDAFIAFSTDEDARQAMMHDRNKINEVQVRLLLSSRAEMQKVIETARQQSVLALQNATSKSAPVVVAAPAAVQPKLIAAAPIVAPQPPIITANSLQTILGTQLGAPPSFLAYQQQAGVTLVDKPLGSSDSSDSRRNSLERRRSDSPRDRRRSHSRERGNNLRRRRDRSRSRSRDRDYKTRRTSRRSSRSRERSQSPSRERSRAGGRGGGRNSRDLDLPGKPTKPGAINPWSVPPAIHGVNSGGVGAYQLQAQQQQSAASNSYAAAQLVANLAAASNSPNPFGGGGGSGGVAARAANVLHPNAALVAALSSMTANNGAGVLPGFQGYGAAATKNNLLGVALGGVNTLQNPYTAAAAVAAESLKAQSGALGGGNSNMLAGALPFQQRQQPQQQQPTQPEAVAFASTNPYAQIYPKLFAQATGGVTANSAAMNTHTAAKQQPFGGGGVDGDAASGQRSSSSSLAESCCVRLSNLCASITYSDVRKFFTGLFIPHNGIKMVNDQNGLRIGVSFIQFSRVADVHKALTRQNASLKARAVRIECVPERDFNRAEDSFRPAGRGNGGGTESSRRSDGPSDGEGDAYRPSSSSQQTPRSGNDSPAQPFTTLFVEDIPAFATEQDVMKIFSEYTLIDILLMPRPENRRENIAYVRFTRPEEARLALEYRAHHMIGHRKVRVRPGRLEEMEHAKEKLRLANEQLIKEERAQAEEEENRRNAEEQAASQKGEASETQRPKGGNANSDDDNDGLDDSGDARPDSGGGDGRGRGRGNNYNSNSLDDEDMDGAPCDPRMRQQRSMGNRFAGNNNSNRNAAPNGHPMRNMMPNFNSNNSNNNNNNNNFPPGNMNGMGGGGGRGGGGGGGGGPVEQSFVLLKNCEYNARINDVADLFMSSNLTMKHIELLRNDRDMPAGEFIVEFRDAIDADIAIKDFNNTQFRGRSLRMRLIDPQEIANRLGKPFMNYFPGGDGDGGGPPNNNNNNNMMMGAGRNNDNNSGGNARRRAGRRNRARGARAGRAKMNGDDDDMDDLDSYNSGPDMDDDDDDDNNNSDGNQRNTNSNNNFDQPNSMNSSGDAGIPAKFNRNGCVIAMENVPFRADLKAILRFFHEFDLTPDDIIRRFNDDGTPTGDARVAFETPEIARNAFELKRRKHIFNRTIYLRLL